MDLRGGRTREHFPTEVALALPSPGRTGCIGSELPVDMPVIQENADPLSGNSIGRSLKWAEKEELAGKASSGRATVLVRPALVRVQR